MLHVSTTTHTTAVLCLFSVQVFAYFAYFINLLIFCLSSSFILSVLQSCFFAKSVNTSVLEKLRNCYILSTEPLTLALWSVFASFNF